MRYPIEKLSNIPDSGSAIYLYLLMNITIPSRMLHELWYNTQKLKLDDPHDPFKGFYPIGQSLKLDYGGNMDYHTFTGEEKTPSSSKTSHSKLISNSAFPLTPTQKQKSSTQTSSNHQ